MAVKSLFRGWPVIWVSGSDKESPTKPILVCDMERMTQQELNQLKSYWVYEDTGERLPATGGKTRPCKKCGKLFPLGEGEVDPCLGVLPGVDSACCGHGHNESAYIRFNNGMIIQGFTDKGKGVPPKKLGHG